MARNSREVARRGTSEIDPADEPSVEWGWHGGFPKGMLTAGWFTVGAMLIMLIGNHEGRTEDIWLIGTAVVMAIGLAMHTVKQRNAWRR